jgi:hypothetical protein
LSEKRDIDIYVQYDEINLLRASKPIDNEQISKTVSIVENILITNGAKSRKIKDVFEISVEVLQNILNYSYGSRVRPDQKREAYGTFKVIYSSDIDEYTIIGENLIESSREAVIRAKIESVADLSDQEIRKLIREKMRTGEDRHNMGAGLGILMITRKSSKPINLQFTEVIDGVKKMRIEVTA